MEFNLAIQLVDIDQRSICPAKIFIQNNRIVAIEPIDESAIQTAGFLMPGFVDSHVHIESSMLIPSEFARIAVMHGTVGTVSDPHEIANVCETLASKGIRVIVAGLDMDYLGNPFGQMPNLLAKADYITKLHAICVRCGNIANISYRLTEQEGQVLLGEKDIYEPRCRVCAAKKALK